MWLHCIKVLIKIVFWYRNKTGLTAVTETLSPRKTKTALLYTKLEESFGFLGPENLTLYVYIKRELSAIGLWLGQEHDKNPPYGRLHSPRAAGWWFSEFHEQDLQYFIRLELIFFMFTSNSLQGQFKNYLSCRFIIFII